MASGAFPRKCEELDHLGRKIEIQRLLNQGMDYREIGERMGFSRTMVCRYVKEVQAEMVEEMRAGWDAYQAQQNCRIEAAIRAIWPLIEPEEGKTVDPIKQLQAIDRLVKLFERQAKLLGLDAQRQEQVKPEEAAMSNEERMKRLQALLVGIEDRTKKTVGDYGTA